ncbi:MAG: type II toxin-antitoxin system VapC family toxin [Candidatus Pacearchaeota archaeon]
MIGADTSFLVDFFKGDKDAVDFMDKNKENLCICDNVVYEFLCGNLKESEIDTFLGFVSQFKVFSFNRDAAVLSSKIFRGSKRKGVSVAHPDVMIAGIYLANNVDKIVTRNKKHFENIKDLKVLRY